MLVTNEINIKDSDEIIQLFIENIDKVQLLHNFCILRINICFYSLYYFDFEQIIKIKKTTKIMDITAFKIKSDFTEIEQNEISEICTTENLVNRQLTHSGRVELDIYTKDEKTIYKSFLYQTTENINSLYIAGDYEIYKIGE